MTPAQRQQLLVGLTGVVVAAFAVDQFLGGPAPRPSASSDGAETAAVGTPAPVGAPDDLDQAGLQARYALILEQEPFAERSFRPKPTARPRPTRRDERPRPSAPPPPERLELRLTGLLGQGEGRVGVLEERSSGRGILAHAGLELGELKVHGIENGGLVLVEDGKRRQLELGDELNLPLELSSRLVALKVTTRESSSPTRRATRSPGGTQPAVEVSAEDRKAILERLRNRRRNSLDSDPAPAPTPDDQGGSE